MADNQGGGGPAGGGGNRNQGQNPQRGGDNVVELARRIQADQDATNANLQATNQRMDAVAAQLEQVRPLLVAAAARAHDNRTQSESIMSKLAAISLAVLVTVAAFGVGHLLLNYQRPVGGASAPAVAAVDLTPRLAAVETKVDTKADASKVSELDTKLNGLGDVVKAKADTTYVDRNLNELGDAGLKFGARLVEVEKGADAVAFVNTNREALEDFVKPRAAKVETLKAGGSETREVPMPPRRPDPHSETPEGEGDGANAQSNEGDGDWQQVALNDHRHKGRRGGCAIGVPMQMGGRVRCVERDTTLETREQYRVSRSEVCGDRTGPVFVTVDGKRLRYTC